MSGKRGKGEGSVRRLPSGSWQSQVMDGYTDEGKRHVVSFTAPTRAEALDKMRAYLLNKDMNPPDEPSKTPLFADYAQNWYIAYRTQVEESTYSNYRYTLNILNKAFGSLPLCDIKVTQVNRFVNNLAAKGYSASQISKCRSMLIQILDVAEADDLVIKNYARRAFRTTKQLSKEKTTHAKDSFSVEETERLLSDLPNNLLGNSIRLMLVSGLRLQELLALTPNDIASDGSWVRVDKAVKMVNGIQSWEIPKVEPVVASSQSPPSTDTFHAGYEKMEGKPFYGVPLGRKVFCIASGLCAESTTGFSTNTLMYVAYPLTVAAIHM